MLNPTIFIGLGTTGRKIIGHLRTLMAEHYGNYLPNTFRFVVFETQKDSTEIAKNQEYHLKVSSVDEAKLEIARGEKPFYQSWLDDRVLNVTSITDGANNSRMLGRFVLWENWSKLEDRDLGVRQILQDIYNEISTLAAREEAINKISAFHRLKGMPAGMGVEEGEPSFYIVGTLCGGTCSGLLIDIAYLCKHIGGLDVIGTGMARPKPVRGFFTVLDKADLNMPVENTKKWAANCWGAILELDYYSNPNTKYDFPFAATQSTSEPPLDLCYLMSRSQGGRRITNDVETLNHQIALAMFAETVGGLRDAIGGIITDFDGVVGDRNSPNADGSMRIIIPNPTKIMYYRSI